MVLSLNSFAQNEFGNKPINIPPVTAAEKKSDAPETSAFPKTNPFALPQNKSSVFDKPKPEPKCSFIIGKKPELNMTPQNDFANPYEGLVDKLNHKNTDEVSKDFKLIRGNQDLGTFNTTAKSLTIKYRDFGEIDGDQIRVYVNGKVVQSLVTLAAEYQGVKVDLEIGFNKIEFEALNQGTVGPNTAEFRVSDDTGKLISANQWNLATGFKASVMVIKN